MNRRDFCLNGCSGGFRPGEQSRCHHDEEGQRRENLLGHFLILAFKAETASGSHHVEWKLEALRFPPSVTPTSTALLFHQSQLHYCTSATKGQFQAPKCITDCVMYVRRAKWLSPSGVVLEDLRKTLRRKQDPKSVPVLIQLTCWV